MWYQNPETLKSLISLAAPILVAIIVLSGTVIGLLYNERSKRRWEILKRKEDRYIELARNSRGFYEKGFQSDRLEKFIEELNVAWLYCPDDVLDKAKNFLSSVKVSRGQYKMTPEDALAELIISIRKDLSKSGIVTKTRFSAMDFEHYGVNSISFPAGSLPTTYDIGGPGQGKSR
jgi:hypothetical protein